jgi:hypothetical protein
MPTTGARRFRFVPGIKAAIQGQIFPFATDAVGRFIIKVLRHPNLIADFHSLVSLAVAQVLEGIRGIIVFAAATIARTIASPPICTGRRTVTATGDKEQGKINGDPFLRQAQDKLYQLRYAQDDTLFHKFSVIPKNVFSWQI